MDLFWITKVVLQKLWRNRCFVWPQTENIQENSKSLKCHSERCSEMQKTQRKANEWPYGRGIRKSPWHSSFWEDWAERILLIQHSLLSGNRDCSQGYKNWGVLVQRLMSANLSTGLKIPWMQQMIWAIGDTTGHLQHLGNYLLEV